MISARFGLVGFLAFASAEAAMAGCLRGRPRTTGFFLTSVGGSVASAFVSVSMAIGELVTADGWAETVSSSSSASSPSLLSSSISSSVSGSSPIQPRQQSASQ